MKSYTIEPMKNKRNSNALNSSDNSFNTKQGQSHKKSFKRDRKALRALKHNFSF